MNKQTMVLIGVLFIAIFQVSSASQAINLSGRWKINFEQSDLGHTGAQLSEMTLDIQHEGINLTIKKTIALRDRDWIIENMYTTDNKECLNDGESLKGLKSVCYFENNKLFIKGEQEGFKINFIEDSPPYREYFKINSVEEYSLSFDKKTLTVNQIMKTDLDEIKVKYVYDKIESSEIWEVANY